MSVDTQIYGRARELIADDGELAALAGACGAGDPRRSGPRCRPARQLGRARHSAHRVDRDTHELSLYFHSEDPWAKSRNLDDRRYVLDHFFSKSSAFAGSHAHSARRIEAERRAAFLRFSFSCANWEAKLALSRLKRHSAFERAERFDYRMKCQFLRQTMPISTTNTVLA